jgi:hypothetical protein
LAGAGLLQITTTYVAMRPLGGEFQKMIYNFEWSAPDHVRILAISQFGARRFLRFL